MADNATEQDQPSIEEILASIRQIISDDEEEPAAPEPVAAPPPPEPEPVPEPEPEPEPEPVSAQDSIDDIFELTEAIEEVEPEAPVRQPIQIDLQEHVEEAPPPPPPPPPPVREPEPVIADLGAEIFTEAAAAATLSSFSRLARDVPVERSSRSGTVTIEDVVRDLLKPILRDWVDQHVPPIVERLVQRELEKLSRQIRD